MGVGMMTEKNFSGYVVLDWKHNTMKVYRFKPKKLNPFQIPVKLDLKVLIPEQREMRASGEIELTASKVREIFLEEI